jgi:quercetin dioxygenase-like cupin family protein
MSLYVSPQSALQTTPIPGVFHATWAGEAEGLSQLSVWRQRLDPGAATPPHSHGCDEVVLCFSGRGEVHVQGEVHRFSGGQTVALPRGLVHQIFNTGHEPMEILGLFAATPVSTALPDGQALDLPWRT